MTFCAGSAKGTRSHRSGSWRSRFGVARGQVRQAVHELLVEGRIERRGRGTVVARPKFVQPLSLKSYTEGPSGWGVPRAACS